MFDRREAPALDATTPDPGRSKPLRLSRRGWLSLGLSLLLLVTLTASGLSRRPIAWLHGQPAYRLAFRDIELRPPPPAWIGSGGEGVLRVAWTRSGLPESFSVLDQDLDALARAFKLSPWVERVERVQRAHPHRLLVQLRYREPAALVRLPGAVLTIDHLGVVLPDDVAPGEPPLVPIFGLGEILQARPGQELRVEGTSHAVLRRAATLAAEARRRAEELPMTVDRVAITPPRRGVTHIWLILRPNLQVLWDALGHPNQPTVATDAEKWARLARWAREPGPLSVRDPRHDYLVFRRGGIELRSALPPL